RIKFCRRLPCPIEPPLYCRDKISAQIKLNKLVMRLPDRKDLLAQLLPIVRTAGDVIMAIYRRGSVEVSQKANVSPVTEADLAGHRVLATHLAHLLPSCQVVSEEDPASLPYRQSAGRFWLIDPLDGTKEFIARNGEFTVNIALIEGGRSTLGVV